MNVVLIVPTGLGAEIGGHAGDANPVAKLLGSLCDNLITHPNVVNASDINEMPENTLYVEGSSLDSFLRGEIGLKKVSYNKVLAAVNAPADIHTIHAISAARATIGMDAFIVELETPLKMTATMEDGVASGEVSGWQELVEQVEKYDFDALAIVSSIDIDRSVAEQYITGSGGVNPWGGVEAKASRLISMAVKKPVAHAPFGDVLKGFKEIVDPRMAAEMVSECYLHCVLKGLHRAPTFVSPRYNADLSVEDISCLVTPAGCVGEPHSACMAASIPIIAVRENTTRLNDNMPDDFIVVDNYLEAAGVIASMRAGVYWPSVRRPLAPTQVYNKRGK